ncbi:hypothetical protein BKA61DRAFT_636082 [Leptodontidium sp. MPI-SDFR-AT-0119]|nr:hypothetical protein BKA61DRAFT_636082 [Leptodontidium sp. MPI-SDFR-AT-0119]
MQPETRPISQEQLIAEVKGIYAGLMMVEAKCIEVDNEQATLAQADPTSQPRLNNQQWQALISCIVPLKRLATKHAMSARLWRHAIHSFLEILRHSLRASLEHMLAFLYPAYSMTALLYETVPVFHDIWMEYLGDLGRYRNGHRRRRYSG